MDEEKLFDKQPEKLVNEDITFDAIINHPILKTISEVTNRIYDLEEMIWKKGKDIEKDRAWIAEALSDVPEYTTSNFVGRIINLNHDMGDIIKLLMLSNSSLKKAITDINETVKEKYGVRASEEEVKERKVEEHRAKKKLEEIDYLGYLKSLIGNDDEGNIAKVIKERIENDNSLDTLKTKFEKVVVNYYKEEEDKAKKKIIGEILSMKIKPKQEVKYD